MNAKQIEAALAAARKILFQYPPGTIVWHRASGKRGVVESCLIAGDGAALPKIAWGENSSCVVYLCELSRSRVPDDDSDAWKGGIDIDNNPSS